ncbi:choice-of-anchor A family protein [Paenibacillus lautus]|uniref:choice-of-anchor A family protein n=1 Tax=Paenibacillus lautus TaxID=1401 RepID=UPI002DB7109C|nr:choice-of-anchor A family protein [Paenibacillus lautus]MEC0309804.1 choice-of-anchor A family protein [Paenibacillus lautus]
MKALEREEIVIACGNLGIANDFNVFVFGDHTQFSVDSEGRVAVGGNATYVDYGIGDRLEVSTARADLIVQGNIDITRGANFSGNTIIYPTSTIINYTMTNNNGVTGQPLRGTPIDFALAQRQLAELSLNLGAVAPNGTVANNFGQILLTGEDPLLNVFTFNGNNVDGSGLRLDTANGVQIVAPSGSTILINVGGENVGFGSYQIFRNGTAATREDSTLIVWNLFQATTAFNQNLTISGSVLAPYANWEARGFGNIDGTIIATSLTNLTGSLEEHNVIFTGCLPEVGPTPTTTTTTSTSTTTTTETTTTTPSPTTTTASTTTSTTPVTTSTTSTTAPAPTTTTTTTTTTPVTTSTTTTTTTVPTPTTTTTRVPATTTISTTSAVPSALITAVKEADKKHVHLGDIITFRIIVTNNSSEPVETVLADVLPSSLLFLLGSVSINGKHMPRLEIQEILLGALSPRQTIEICFKAIVVSIPEDGKILNSGSIISFPQGSLPPTCSPFQRSLTGPPGVSPAPGQLLPVSPVIRPGFTPLPGENQTSGPVVLPDGDTALPLPPVIPGITIAPRLGFTLPVLGGNSSDIIQTHDIIGKLRFEKDEQLTVVKSVNADDVVVLQRVTFSIVIVNLSSTVSGDTILTDVLPSGYEFIPGTVVVGRELRLRADPRAGIQSGSISPNQGIEIRFDCIVSQGKYLLNTSRVRAEFVKNPNRVSVINVRSNPVRNKVQTTATGNIIQVATQATASLVNVGEIYEYSIVVRNRSSSLAARNVFLFDTISDAAQFVSGSLRLNGVPQPDPRIAVFLGTLAPGSVTTVSFRVRVQYDPDANRIVNQAAAFFEFIFDGKCIPGAFISNQKMVRTEPEQEE